MRRGLKSAEQQWTDRSGEYGPHNVLVTGRIYGRKSGTALLVSLDYSAAFDTIDHTHVARLRYFDVGTT